ncbi:hypothetical protein EMIT0P201_80064 [Pseudomonas chlororaphis]
MFAFTLFVTALGIGKTLKIKDSFYTDDILFRPNGESQNEYQAGFGRCRHVSRLEWNLFRSPSKHSGNDLFSRQHR